MPRPQATPRACTSQETTSIPKGDTGMTNMSTAHDQINCGILRCGECFRASFTEAELVEMDRRRLDPEIYRTAAENNRKSPKGGE